MTAHLTLDRLRHALRHGVAPRGDSPVPPAASRLAARAGFERLTRLPGVSEASSPLSPSGASEASSPLSPSGASEASSPLSPSGASEASSPLGPCTVVRQCCGADVRYGRRAMSGYATLSGTAFDVLAGQPDQGPGPRAGRVVFLDLETTGLSGGAATVAFVVGLGWFDTGAFATRQYVLRGFADEPRVLAALSGVLGEAPALVTFNGKSFDLPVLESRWAYHRMSSPLATLPHLDLLHPSRRLWPGDDGTLVGLERAVLGVRRVGDVPGAEIPGRYIAYLRDGDARHLEPVLEHNRLDLRSLAGLTGLACRLVDHGVCATDTAAQALGLGRILDRAGRAAESAACYERAASDDGGACDNVSAEALRQLARRWRRQRRYRDAALAWRRLLDLSCPPAGCRREAMLALAVHHEHRTDDPVEAWRLARRALHLTQRHGHRLAIEHRLSRLERKLEQQTRGTLV